MVDSHLGALDLASLLAGYLSLGCSLWSAFPQIYLLASFPPSGGPLIWMLVLWLLGDALQVSGMYIHGALDTQKLSGIWFGISDVIIMLEMAIGRGWVPGTSCWRRRKLGKTHTPVSVGEDRGVEVEDVGYGPTPLEGPTKSRTRGRRAGMQDWVRAHFPNVDGPRVNLVVLIVLIVVATGCWAALDVIRWADKPALKPGEPPQTTASWIGWGTALAGMVFYNYPRGVQIRKIHRDKGMEHTSVWMFGWLLAQNYTMLISILTVSHTRSALFGQAPFLTNTVLALMLDHVIVYLWHKYQHTQRPDSPAHILPHPTQAGVARAASILSRRTSHRASLRRNDHGDSDRERNERARQKLEKSYDASLQRERARATGPASSIPTHKRRQLAHSLDEHAAAEDSALSDLDDRMGSADEHERQRHAEWVRQSSDKRAQLQATRERRRRSDARAEGELEGELEDWKEDRARRRLPVGSDEEDSGFSSSGDESSAGERPLTRRSDSNRSRHPRRGVGTSSR